MKRLDHVDQNTDLKATFNLAISDCFKDRLRAEYYQTYIRYFRLINYIFEYQNGYLDHIPRCPLSLLVQQSNEMASYLDSLTERCALEGANLELPLNYRSNYNYEEDDDE